MRGHMHYKVVKKRWNKKYKSCTKQNHSSNFSFAKHAHWNAPVDCALSDVHVTVPVAIQSSKERVDEVCKYRHRKQLSSVRVTCRKLRQTIHRWFTVVDVVFLVWRYVSAALAVTLYQVNWIQSLSFSEMIRDTDANQHCLVTTKNQYCKMFYSMTCFYDPISTTVSRVK